LIIIQPPAEGAVFGLHDGVEVEIGVGDLIDVKSGGVAVGEEEIGLGEFAVAGADAHGVGGVDVHEDAVEEAALQGRGERGPVIQCLIVIGVIPWVSP